jgi:DNA-binding NarL/FixJ family response regulator
MSDAQVDRSRPLRVAIAEDSGVIRQALGRLLREVGFEVVGEAATSGELMALVRRFTPEVVITDIRMPPTQTDEGLRAAEAIRSELPHVSVILLSQVAEPAYAMRLLGTDGRRAGYLLKDRVADGRALADAVRRVAGGESVVDPVVVAELVSARVRRGALDALTERERNVLELMGEGRSNVAIAERLVVTLRTVETHVANIFGKLGLEQEADVNRRVLAVLAWLRAR